MNHCDWLDEFLLSMPGVTKDYKAEWDWWRYQVGGKLFAATMCPAEKYAPEYAGRQLVNLKCEPMLAELLRGEHPDILPGFYSDKTHWNSVRLDGELPEVLPEVLLRELCEQSYRLVFAKLTKKAQREIAEK